MSTSTRLYKGREIAYRPLSIPFHVGGHGPVSTTLYEVWNPAKAERRIVLTPDAFEALTTPAACVAA